MEEKNAPHPQLLSGETRAAACLPATTQAHTVAFSVSDIQWLDSTRTQDIQSHKLLSFPMVIFVSAVANVSFKG